MKKVKVEAEQVFGSDLKPGELFSTEGSWYWDEAMDSDSIGERVYIRTNAPTPVQEQSTVVYRLTIKEGT